ncbi:MAG TPA: DinB family protein [Cyclobacteriaceae bacterium]|nr:DinB family protein [Cyclobacteriaceae bacterium]
MNNLPWFERNLKFGYPKEMLPYFLERLEGSIVRIQTKVKGVDDKVLSNKLNNKWSIKQNIGHLAEVDEIANKRLDEMVNGITPMSPAVFEPQDYNPWSIERVLELFKNNRLKNLTKYKSIRESDLLKSSLHPRLKVEMTPVDLAWFDAEHDDHHLVTINGILKELNPSS